MTVDWDALCALPDNIFEIYGNEMVNADECQPESHRSEFHNDIDCGQGNKVSFHR